VLDANRLVARDGQCDYRLSRLLLRSCQLRIGAAVAGADRDIGQTRRPQTRQPFLDHALRLPLPPDEDRDFDLRPFRAEGAGWQVIDGVQPVGEERILLGPLREGLRGDGDDDPAPGESLSDGVVVREGGGVLAVLAKRIAGKGSTRGYPGGSRTVG